MAVVAGSSKSNKRQKSVKGQARPAKAPKLVPAPAAVKPADDDDDDSEDDGFAESDEESVSGDSDDSDDVTEEGLQRLMALLDTDAIQDALQGVGAGNAVDDESDDQDDDDAEESSDGEDGDDEPKTQQDQPAKSKATVLDRVHATFKLRPGFFDNLNLVYSSPLDIPKPDDDLQRELQFYKQALWGALEAQSRFKTAQLPFHRPDDFFAEMLKSDAQMAKIRQALLDESASIKASQEARKLRDAKKFGKKVQVERKKEREREEKAVGKKLDSLKKKRRNREAGFENADDFDIALENALETSKDRKKKVPESERRKMPRKVRNSKFGRPTTSRRPKENNDRTDPPPFAKSKSFRGKAGRSRRK